MRKRNLSFFILIILALGFSTIMISSIEANTSNKTDSGEAITQEIPSLRKLDRNVAIEPSVKRPQFSVQSEIPEPTVEILQFNDHEMSLRGYGNDTIRFNIEFKSAQRAYFEANVELFSNETGTPVSVSRVAYWSDWVDPNIVRVASIDICGYDIRENGINGPYNVSLYFAKDNGTIYTIYNYEFVHITKSYLASDFVENPVSLISITDNFIDNDINNKYEWIDINITLNVAIPSDYYIYGYIQQSSGGSADGAAYHSYLTVDNHSIILRFAGWKFQDMSFADTLTFYGLYIRHDSYPSYEVYSGNPNHITGTYDPSEFDIPPINVTGNIWGELIDSEPDGSADYYRVTVEVNKTRMEDGRFHLYASLYINSTDQQIENRWMEWNDTVMRLDSTGLVNVTINFNGILIYKSGITSDHFLVKDISVDYEHFDTNWGDWIDSSSISWISGSSYSFTQFEGPGAFLTDNFNDYGKDTDGDLLFNQLVVEVEVDVIKPGDYYIESGLTAPSIGNTIVWASNYTSFPTTGPHWVELRFDGSKIFQSGVNDVLELSYVYLYLNDPWTELDSNHSVTLSSYVFTEFDPPKARFTGIYSDTTADTNGDGLWDELQIHVEVEINSTGYYRVNGDLRNPITDEYQYITSDRQYCGVTGTYSFVLRFSGKWIWTQRTKTTYILSYVNIYEVDAYDNYVQEWDYKSNPFTTDFVYDSDDFNPPSIYVKGIIDDYVIDLNQDGLYDRWRVVFEIQINEEDITFYFNTRLVESGSNNWITDYSRYYSGLSLGTHNLTIDFRCDQIYQSGFSGGVKIEHWHLGIPDQNEWYDKFPNYQLAGNYDWDDFSPDILFIEQVWPEPGSVFIVYEEAYFEVRVAKTPSITVYSVMMTIEILETQYTVELYRDYQDSDYEYWRVYLLLDSEGSWNITIQVTGSNNLIDSLEMVIYVGSPPVFVSFLYSFPSVSVGGTVQFIVFVRDFDGIANVSLISAGIEHPMEFMYNLSLIEEVWGINVTFDTLGEFQVYARAWDTKGLYSSSEGVTIFVNEGPQIISVNISPSREVDLGTPVTFTAHIMKSDAIITSVQIEAEDKGSNLYTIALEESDETETTEIYSGTFTPEVTGEYICRLRVMDTRNRVSTYETRITVLGESTDKVSPGFEFLLLLIMFTVLPVGKRHFQRKKV
jgi:hypothetical protein